MSLQNEYVDITPVMTSNTTPAGYVASASSVNGTLAAWQAFDSVDTTTSSERIWHSAGGVPQWIMMQFPESVQVDMFSIKNRPDTGNAAAKGITAFQLQGSNNGSSFDTLGTYTSDGAIGATKPYTVETPGRYKYYRVYITSAGYSFGGTQYALVEQIRFYARLSTPPSAPEYFNASASGGAVQLNWAAGENTLGYLLYRNGELIADTAETSYTDTGAEIYSGYQYTLVPYNGDGNGTSVSLNIIVKGDPRPLGDLITDRTAADVATHTRKGVYNASDLNRVAAAAEYVHGVLSGLGYRVPDQPDRAWFVNEIPDRGEMNAHHNAVVGLDVIRYAHEKVVLPPNLEKLTYERANNIEKFLLLCGEAAERIPEAYIYSDELYGGEFS